MTPIFGLRKAAKNTDADASAPENQTEEVAGADGAEDSENEKARGKRRGAKKERALRPDEMLQSVISESSPGPTLALLEENTPFVLPHGRGYIVLGLNVDSIGGLSKRQRNDEVKGRIVEQIEADKIQIVASAEMLAEQFFGIIPNPQTFEYIREYSLLTDTADYYWIRVTGENEDSELKTVPMGPADLRDAEEISRGEKKLSDLIRIEGAEASKPATQQLAPVEEPAPAPMWLAQPAPATDVEDSVYAPQAAAQASENEQPFPEEVEEIQAPAADAGEELLDAEGNVDFTGFVDQPAGDGYGDVELDDIDSVDDIDYDGVESVDDGGYEAPADADPEVELDDAQFEQAYEQANEETEWSTQDVRARLERHYLPDDLDLVISTDLFEDTFATDAPMIVISEIANDPGTSWLEGQIAQQVRQANAELRLMHRNHTIDQRALYLDSLNMYAEQIAERLTPGSENVDPDYAALSELAEKDYRESLEGVRDRVADEVKQLRETFDASVKSTGDAAKAQAEQQYRVRHSASHEAAIVAVSTKIAREIEATHEANLHGVLQVRRTKAQTQMERGITEMLAVMSERWKEDSQKEADLLANWNARLLAFIEENRKHDIAQAEVLADKLSRDDQMAVAMREHDERISALKSEHLTRVEEIRSEANAARERLLAEYRELDARRTADLSNKDVELSASQKVIQTLEGQIDLIREETERKYASDFEGMRRTIEDQSHMLSQTNDATSRSMKLMIFLLVAIALVAILAGVVIGWTIAGGAHAAPASAMILPTLGFGAGGGSPSI